MKDKIKKWIRPALFIFGGVLAGFAHYYFVGCTTGCCAITSNPVNSMIYMGLIGWLLSGVFGRECDDRSSM